MVWRWLPVDGRQLYWISSAATKAEGRKDSRETKAKRTKEQKVKKYFNRRPPSIFEECLGLFSLFDMNTDPLHCPDKTQTAHKTGCTLTQTRDQRVNNVACCICFNINGFSYWLPAAPPPNLPHPLKRSYPGGTSCINCLWPNITCVWEHSDPIT